MNNVITSRGKQWGLVVFGCFIGLCIAAAIVFFAFRGCLEKTLSTQTPIQSLDTPAKETAAPAATTVPALELISFFANRQDYDIVIQAEVKNNTKDQVIRCIFWQLSMANEYGSSIDTNIFTKKSHADSLKILPGETKRLMIFYKPSNLSVDAASVRAKIIKYESTVYDSSFDSKTKDFLMLMAEVYD